MKDLIRNRIKQSIQVKQLLLENDLLLEQIGKACGLMIESLANGGRIMFCGNGGSAADAQHLAAELTGYYLKKRAPLSAVALGTNFSHLTAVANDAGYKDVFSRLVLSEGRTGDCLVCLSTSGNSTNIVNAALSANSNGIHVIGMTGNSTSSLEEHSHICVQVPSQDVPRIQEAHILIGHLFCEIIENHFFDS